ncbi:hypothetical protein [Acinetobacter stercoris]|uniref:Uncharacterized protein n=1 Tax=Acinetobacter stercoris TaxID=2126983 RepID=A0A2U3MU72_9GAMM|nr:MULTISPECIES: hypothetical protein [Acinetobacter]SPL68990.1 hypothetical protein KPC_0168 [Acinetobacter stercoris]
MPQKKFNKFLAPIVIAGITVGFLASAYKFVFAKPKKKKQETHQLQNDLYSENQQTDEIEEVK